MMWEPHFHAHLAVAIIFLALPLTATSVSATNETIPFWPAPTESYLRNGTSWSLLYCHIFFMSLSWMFALPIYLVFNIARSHLRYPSHIIFLSLHGIGTIFGMIYNSKTPDYYPNDSHSKVGWILTVLICAHFAVGVLRSFLATTDARSEPMQEEAPFIPMDAERGSYSCTRESPGTESPYSERSDSSSGETDAETMVDVHLHYNPRLEHRYDSPMSWRKRWSNVSGAPLSILVLDLGYDLVGQSLVVFGFAGICTGIVTVTGIFHGNHIFNGLAHFIKGSVFLGFGIITLSRWMGCFARRGWAWNSNPSISSEPTSSISMEAVECFFIFLYGIINVFLEHLAAWGGAWAPQDFEHVAISLLFVGGGSCGLMIESRALQHSESSYLENTFDPEDEFSKHTHTRRSAQPINPIPAMIIFLLGLILGGHHQTSMESTMMHKQFGNLLTAAAMARCITYLLLHIRPATTSPSRPPSELVCSFCLMCGGFMLMASNKDTVQSMIDNKINAMLVATVIMGTTAMLMAWIIFVLTVKSWAQRRERSRS